MRPEYAKYRDFTKKIQKAKSTRRAGAVARRRIPRPARARVARASRASRGTSRHNPLARFRVASRARTHPSSAPVAHSPVKFPARHHRPRAMRSPSSARVSSASRSASPVAARAVFRSIALARSRRPIARASSSRCAAIHRHRARVFAPKNRRATSEKRGVSTFIEASIASLMAFASAAKRATKKSFRPYPIDVDGSTRSVLSSSRRDGRAAGPHSRARGARRRAMTARATRGRARGRRDGLGRARDGARGRHRAWRARTTTTVMMMALTLTLTCAGCLLGFGARGTRASGDATAVVKARFDRHGPDGEVVDLSETNFDEVVGRGTPVLVKVYAEWCKHCVALAPVWGEVARELEGELFVGRVDGPKNRLLLKRIGAKAYPTIALFKNGKMYEYESGDRSVAAIVSFARKDYRKTKARGFFHAVWFSKGLRLLYAVPAIGEKAYAYLHRDLRLSNVAILFLTLCVPVMAGMFAIFVADMMICRGVLQETRAMYRNGNRGGGENAGGAPRRPHFD